MEWLETLLYEAREELKESSTHNFLIYHTNYKTLLTVYNKAKEYYNG